ncbi:FCH-domain-containing protein [Gigaspora margarita]|uniref:Protein BZZ1 n=1 Tax=Gigaspora margarita TaxID=4874 RepID=A0A8H3X8S1_GIGMA|nr:FCH-domain-containing protein [Gigaspora margarita]
MSFGSELKDQITSVSQFVQNGIQFLNEFRDFVKERAQIEKEYAGKIDALAKKYSTKKDKKAVSMSVGEVANTLSEKDFNDAKSEPSTFLNAWTSILEETENIAKERFKFSESLSTIVMERVKTVAVKKEETRKKHMMFAQKLKSDRDKIYNETQKAKDHYYECCVEAQSSKQRQERAPDERLLEKLRKQTLDHVIEMNNSKNMYILSIIRANEHKKKYYHADLPALIDLLQDLNESKIFALKRIWNEYVNLELNVLRDSQTHLDLACQNIKKIDARTDSQLFIKYNEKSWNDPPDFVFESSPTFADTGEFVIDENTQVFLNNQLSKSKRKLPNLISTIEEKSKQIVGLKSLKEAYENNSNLGDSEAVTDNLHEAIREVTIMETLRTTCQTEVDSIIQVIDNETDGQSHNFRNAAFTIPTTCDLCQNTIWGIAKQGFTCKDCGYNCHAKCEMRVPPNCTKKKGELNRGTITSGTFSNIVSPWGTMSGISSNNRVIGETISNISSSTNDKEEGETWIATVLYDYIAEDTDGLSVTTGDVITVIELDDGTGWVKALHNGQDGLVPASYIEYQNLDSNDYVQALYDYDAQSPEEISIREGDIILITNRDVGDGWWEGTLDGVTGQFPASYVGPLEQ